MPTFKTTPRVRLRIRPVSAIPTGGNQGFSFAIALGDCIGTAGGTSTGPIAGLPVLNPLQSRAWDSPTQLKSVAESLEFCRFSKDGRVYFGASAQDAGGEDEFSGFVLRRVETPLDSRGSGDTTNADKLAGIVEVLWTSVLGTWAGVQLGTEGRARGLTTVSNQGTLKAKSGVLAANQGTRWTISAEGTRIANGSHILRCAIADGLYIVSLQHGKPPRFQKRVNAQDVEFAPLKGAANADLRSGMEQVLHFFRLCGRLIIGWQGMFWWVAEYATPEAAQENDPSRRVEVSWTAGACTVEAIGVRPVVSLATVDFDTLADESKRQLVLDIGALSYPYQGDGETGIPTGWLKYGTARVDIDSTENRGFVTLTVNGSADKHDTPLVNKVSGRFPDIPYDAGSGDAIDVSRAVREATLDEVAPPFSNMASMTIALDRKHLDRINIDWGDTIKQFCVLTWEACFDYTDGVTDIWTPFFEGICPKVDTGTRSVNEQHMNLTCFDFTYLLKAPAALVDHSDPPLDLFYLLKLQSSNNVTNSGGAPYNPIYPPIPGGLPQNVTRLEYTFTDAVRDIKYLKRGPGDGVLIDYTENLFPVFTTDNDLSGYARAEQVASGDTQPPTTNGWLSPAPQGADGIGWIEEICDKANLVYFRGHTPDDGFTEFPKPILASLDRLLANRVTHIVTDTIFDGLSQDVIAEWVNHVADSIEREARPDAVINHVTATSSGFFSDSNDSSGYPPRIAEAYLPASDVNSEKNIRHRRSFTKDVGPLGGFPGGVEAYALELINQLEIDKEYTWPSVTIDGRCWNPAHNDRPIAVGDKMQFKFGTSVESDSGLNLNNRVFRVASVRHVWALGESVSSHKSEISFRPISGAGL